MLERSLTLEPANTKTMVYFGKASTAGRVVWTCLGRDRHLHDATRAHTGSFAYNTGWGIYVALKQISWVIVAVER